MDEFDEQCAQFRELTTCQTMKTRVITCDDVVELMRPLLKKFSKPKAEAYAEAVRDVQAFNMTGSSAAARQVYEAFLPRWDKIVDEHPYLLGIVRLMIAAPCSSTLV